MEVESNRNNILYYFVIFAIIKKLKKIDKCMRISRVDA